MRERLQNCRFQQLDNLPDGLDEGGGHEAAADEFEDRAAEQADEAAPTGSESLAHLFAAQEFAKDSSDERANDDAYRAEEQPDEHTNRTTPHSPACAAEALSAPCRNNIVKHSDNNSDDAPNKQELPREIHTIGSLCDPQAYIGDRCARESGNDATDDADEHHQSGEDEECYFHDGVWCMCVVYCVRCRIIS